MAGLGVCCLLKYQREYPQLLLHVDAWLDLEGFWKWQFGVFLFLVRKYYVTKIK